MINNSYNASVGATALKLDDQYEAINTPQHSFEPEQQVMEQNETSLNLNDIKEETVSENSDRVLAEENLFEVDTIEKVTDDNESPLTLEEEYTPKLFSDETTTEKAFNSFEAEEQKLFDQEKYQDEDFEIPAFLRRQKF